MYGNISETVSQQSRIVYSPLKMSAAPKKLIFFFIVQEILRDSFQNYDLFSLFFLLAWTQTRYIINSMPLGYLDEAGVPCKPSNKYNWFLIVYFIEN